MEKKTLSGLYSELLLPGIIQCHNEVSPRVSIGILWVNLGKHLRVFVFCRINPGTKSQGKLVVTQMAGCSQRLQGQLLLTVFRTK